ncbi:MAG: xylF, partial [Frankiales bacterium]|nr:xylF [Frankiales bacterium]
MRSLSRPASRGTTRPTHRAALAASLLVVALGASACGSNDDTAGNDTAAPASAGASTAAAATPTAACKLTSPPTSAAKAPAGGTSTAKASGKVGVILPDTTSSTRYTLYDKPLLQKALSDAGVTPDIQNAGGSVPRFQAIAQQMIGSGVKVLIIDSIDATSGAAVEKQAAAAGVKVIDYDRVNLGGTADYYVSFDNEDVGRLQGQTLVDCLDSSGVQNAQVIVMSGGKDVDNNAVLFEKGALSVLKPLESSGKLKIASVST